MIINTNIPAMNTHRQLGVNQTNMQNSMEKLSSGLRINRAGDDAAGLAISEKMRAQIKGLDQASRNAQDGISMIQTAEGALDETHNILQRMRELSVQAANDTNVDVDRSEIQKEINQLTAEIDRISETTEFNTRNILKGQDDSNPEKAFKATFQVGANKGQSMEISIHNMSSQALGLSGTTATGAHTVTSGAAQGGTLDALTDNGAVSGAKYAENSFKKVGNTEYYALSVANNEEATNAIEAINHAIEAVSSQRSELGAYQNRLEHTISNLDNASENLSAAESRIRDVDMASEMMEMTRANILSQASQAMLAQANQAPQSVLQLLG